MVNGVSLVGRAVTVSVPASSANLGSGFDTLAMALELRNLVELTVTSTSGGHTIVRIGGQGAHELPRDATNPVAIAARDGLRLGGYAHADRCSISIVCTNTIPLARGLGSSAAAWIGGLVAGTVLATGSSDLLDDGTLAAAVLALADEAEGHPDNAAAALYGGIVVAMRDNDTILVRKIDPLDDAMPVVVIPERRASTDDMRAALPLHVPLIDAAHNVASATLGTLALERGEIEGFALLAGDRLHEPYRGVLYPELDSLRSAAIARGAVAATLSGSGPSVLAVVDASADPEAPETVASGLEAVMADLALDGVVEVVPIALRGAVVERLQNVE